MHGRRLLPSLLVVTLLTAACDGEASGPLQVRENAFSWRGTAAAGTTVHVRDFAGTVEVKPSADDSVRVSARLEWRKGDPDKELAISAANVGRDLLVCAIWGKGRCTVDDYDASLKLGRDGTDARLHFTVEVPTGVRVDASNISGDLIIAASAPVTAKTLNGSVRVVTAVGPVQAETLNGAVDIRMASLVGTDSVIAKTLNGAVYVYLPAVDDAVLDLGVANGRASSAFPLDAPSSGKSVKQTIGAGTRVIYAHSMNGEVALRQLDAEGRAP